MNNGYFSLTLLLVGPLASGKGIFSNIAKTFGFHVIGSGDILRKKASEGDERIKHFLDNGVYVPSKLVFPLVVNNIPDEYYGLKICLDGFPRTRCQAEKLIDLLQPRKTRLVVIEIEIDSDISRKRAIERHRDDDNCPTIKKRMEEHLRNADAMYAYLKRHCQAYHKIQNNSRKDTFVDNAIQIIRSELKYSNLMHV